MTDTTSRKQKDGSFVYQFGNKFEQKARGSIGDAWEHEIGAMVFAARLNTGRPQVLPWILLREVVARNLSIVNCRC
jgi:hypothetical protein